MWTLEVRIDGQPAGSHAFELVIPEQRKEPVAPVPPRPPTLDEIYRAATPALVWVHRLDRMGRNADTSSGFIIGPDRIATAFQAIDGAGGIEVEFSGGRKVKTYEVWASDRLADWAVLKQHIPPLPTGDPAAVAIGDRLILFDVEGGRARMLGGVDFAGRDQQAPFDERLRITPSPFPESMGGPLFDPMGRVIGIVGGSIAPGARSSRMDSFVSPGLWTRFDARKAATPITVLRSKAESAVTLEMLIDRQLLTPPLQPVPQLAFLGTTRSMPKLMDGFYRAGRFRVLS